MTKPLAVDIEHGDEITVTDGIEEKSVYKISKSGVELMRGNGFGLAGIYAVMAWLLYARSGNYEMYWIADQLVEMEKELLETPQEEELAQDDGNTYEVFVRDGYKSNPSWPMGREPQWGDEEMLAENVSLGVARQMCKEYNESHEPGLMKRMAEFRKE